MSELTPNERYRRILHKDYTVLRRNIGAAKQRLQEEYNLAILAHVGEAELKKRRGKRKRVQDWELLLPEDHEAVRPLFVSRIAELNEYSDARKHANDLRIKRLYELAPQVVVEPSGELQEVADAWTGAYSTQTQPDFYAENQLRPLRLALEAKGCRTEIRKRERDYVLFADVPKYAADAVDRLISMKQRCSVWKQVAANPRVYCPFLPSPMGDL